MRKSAQYLVASALAAALVGGLALAATKLTPAPHKTAMVYCSSTFGTPQFAKCPGTPMVWDSPALGTPASDWLATVLEMGGLELHSGKPEKEWPGDQS